ncbi:MAG: dihydrolipoamide acetyltransferase family protein [Actinomycetota bacterium]
MSEQQFRLPDVGEGLTEAEIVSWKVQVGDVVAVNDIVVEIETAKSLVDLPVPFAGEISALFVSEGQTVPVGMPIVGVRVGEDPATTVTEDFPAATQNVQLPTDRAEAAVLVGYGPQLTGSSRRNRRVLAKPPVRKIAKDLGVEMSAVPATGPGGTVTREDVQAYAGQRDALTDRETRVPVWGVRKVTAQAVSASAFTAPHVTEFVTLDATRTMKLVAQLRGEREFADVRVTPLLIVCKALLIAAQRNPGINAAWDEPAQEIVVKHYVNLGIAVATSRGLVVPNVKDAHAMSLHELASALDNAIATARAGKSTPVEQTGGTISITNVGVFGVDSGTPILNPGEAAILAFGAIRERPWVHRGKVRPRQVTTLALSFDHRLVDGDLASRFLADLAAVVERPARALVWC